MVIADTWSPTTDWVNTSPESPTGDWRSWNSFCRHNPIFKKELNDDNPLHVATSHPTTSEWQRGGTECSKNRDLRALRNFHAPEDKLPCLPNLLAQIQCCNSTETLSRLLNFSKSTRLLQFVSLVIQCNYQSLPLMKKIISYNRSSGTSYRFELLRSYHQK